LKEYLRTRRNARHPLSVAKEGQGVKKRSGLEGKRIRVQAVAHPRPPPVRPFTNGTTVQGARHPRDSGWLKFGFGPSRACLRGFRCSQPPLGGQTP
jgi:hypothetical protein